MKYTFKYLTSNLLVGIAILLFVSFVVGQNAQKFKIGDRVECDMSGSRTYWDKGTIIPFKDGDRYNGQSPDSGYFYRVRLDKIPDAPEGYLMKADDLRPLAPPKPSQKQNENRSGNVKKTIPQKTDENNTSTEEENDNSQSSFNTSNGGTCQIMTNPKTTGAASASLFKAIIKAMTDKEAKPGMDGAVCLEFTNFQMGAPQQWRPESDPRRVGTDRLGTKPKTIYQVKADYIITTDYRTEWAITEWTKTVYTCFKDESFGNWKCRGEQGFDWQYKSQRIAK